MKLVLDSNVIIAAFAARGLCHSLLEVCLCDHTIFLSDYLINEIINNLGKKLKLPDQIIEEIISFLKNHTEIVSPQPLEKRICRDQDDDHVISLATSVKSDYIISGDNDLLAIKKYKSINILTPRDFWNLMQKQKREKF
jgi:putative PIN family toxin of toxin-antitoxin system